MANKRMFSVDVVETDAFLDLPPKVQALYFHLGMRADDDGFVSSPRTIVRTIGCNAGDLKQLEAAGYVISFNSGVLVVTDWKVNNFLRKDRHANTVHQSELAQLTELSTGRYILGGSGQPNNNQRSTGGQPHGNQSSTQYSIEKDAVHANGGYAGEAKGERLEAARQIFDGLPAMVQRWAGSPRELCDLVNHNTKSELNKFTRPGFNRMLASAPLMELQPAQHADLLTAAPTAQIGDSSKPA